VNTAAALTATLSHVQDGGTACPSAPGTCCETSADRSSGAARVPFSFDLDTGVLVWDGKTFEPLRKLPQSPDGGKVTYDVRAPTNTKETIEVGSSVLNKADASLSGYSGVLAPWLSARAGGDGGTAGDRIYMSTETVVVYDPAAGTLSVVSFREPVLTTGTGCNPSGQLRVNTATVRVAGADASGD